MTGVPGQLRTHRLLLTPMAQSDAGLYCSLHGDARVMQHVGGVLSPARATRAFAAAIAQTGARPPRALYWTVTAVEVPGDGGLVALVRDREMAGSAELGVLLLPDWQGRGYATEAIARVARHALSELGLSRLWTRHEASHGMAGSLMRRLGFAPLPRSGSGSESMLRWQFPPPAMADGEPSR